MFKAKKFNQFQEFISIAAFKLDEKLRALPSLFFPHI